VKSKLLIAVSLVALVVPATSLGSPPNGQDRANGARACRALRASMGTELFRQSYGTVEANRNNAFGRCVSQWVHRAHQLRMQARAACTAEQADPNFAASHDGKSFDEVYGTGPQHRQAFQNCVASKLQTATTEAQSDTKNAAKECKAERANMPAADFRSKYGKNENDRNAFGKCVSQLAKAQG
jgi:hypothetical protein